MKRIVVNSKTKKSETSALAELKLLALMCTQEDVVKEDIEYMEMYYPQVDQIYNEGRLTLVSKNFMEWAKVLVTAINLSITKQKICEKKNRVMLDARSAIVDNKSIFTHFQQSASSLPNVTNEILARCHKAVILKAMKARAKTVFKQFHENFIGHYSK